MRRRDFIAGLGSAVSWPLAAGEQRPAMPVIGYLSGRSAESDVSMLAAFRRGSMKLATSAGTWRSNIALRSRG
jgi:hypothetical protein